MESKNKVIKPMESDSEDDDDMPPPLEDMSDHLQAIKTIKDNDTNKVTNAASKTKNDEEEEEIRLAPKKMQTSALPTANKSIPMATEYNEKKVETKAPQTQPVVAAQKKNASGGFGGMQGGFLNRKPQPKSVQQVTKPAEDLTHIKAKPKEEQLKFSEVQDAMAAKLTQNKEEWLNEEFFAKMAKNPKLLQAFTNPQFSGIIQEFSKNPQETMKKYGGNPQFREIMEDFSKLMGNHFEDVADKKKREAEEAEQKRLEEMKNDPVMQIIETDQKVKEILADPKIQKILEHLRFTGALDLYDVMRKDQQTGIKLQYLIQKGVLNGSSNLPLGQ